MSTITLPINLFHGRHEVASLQALPKMPAPANVVALPVSLEDRVELGRNVNWKNIGVLAGGAVVGAGVGVYAGLAAGPLAAVAGVATGGAGGAVAGVLLGAVLTRHGGEEAQACGLLWGALAGGGVGAVGGGIVGARSGNPVAAVAMGALGGLAGFACALVSMTNKEEPKPSAHAQPPVQP